MSKTIQGSKETSIYIIDNGYRIVYFNNTLKRKFPGLQTGEQCFKALCQENTPCQNCPLITRQDDISIFFNKYLQRWVEVNTGVIEWPDKGDCNMVICREIHEGNKNLFYNMTSVTNYDELYELNLTKDRYAVLYHQKDKYVLPSLSGSISGLVHSAFQHIIHPKERQAFGDFWDLSSLTSRLNSITDREKYLKGQFRRKLTNGDYCWTLHTIVPLRQSENNDQIVMCFVQDINKEMQWEEKFQTQKSLRDATLDHLTGLYKRSVFFENAEKFLRRRPKQSYCLIAIDIEHFKLFNEWYGRKAGNNFLVSIAGHLKEAANDYQGIAGYMSDDDFVIILPDDPQIIALLQDKITSYIKQYGKHAGFLPAFGIYKIDDLSISVNTMYDRAAIAMESVKGNYTNRVSWYDTGMMQKMEENLLLLSEVQRALAQGEFTFYAQPKCNMSTGKIVGLESLVRWIHPKRGLIAPDEFIPLLESNGFISDLDFYVWEKVCLAVRKLIDQGCRPIPISVNVSRLDIYTLDVVDCFQSLVNKYDLEPQLIEIEITESAYTEEYDKIKGVINQLRQAGFTVLIDDFGSGYSSLNMLKDVNADILKIDMNFLDIKEESAEKGLGILEAVVHMARYMNMNMIAEGVETKEQMEFLLDIGCLYGQGYYFYKPMPMEVFEPLLTDENNIDYRGVRAQQVKRLQIKDLLNENVFSNAMVNNILGGIAFYQVNGDQVKIIRANEQYYQITGDNPVDLAEHSDSILELIYEADRPVILDIFQRAMREITQGAKGEVHRLKTDGSSIWVQFHAFFLGEHNGRKLFYGSISDITALKEKEQLLATSQRALFSMVDISPSNSAFARLTEENKRTAAAIAAQISLSGMIGGYCEPGFPLYFANQEMVKILGYDTYDEFAQAINYRVINTIHPDDRERVGQDLGSNYYVGMEYTTTYRMSRKDGSWFWTLDKGRVIQAEDGRLAIVSACTDISETVTAQQKLSERNALLMRQNQELKYLNNDIPGGYHCCAFNKDFDFIYFSKRFLAILGYEKTEIAKLFNNKFINMVHPEDRIKVFQGAKHLQDNGKPHTMEYRMLSKNGYIWVINQSKYIAQEGKGIIQGVIIDATKTVEMRQKMQLLIDYTPENIVLAKITVTGDISFEVIANGLYRSLGCTKDFLANILNNQSYSGILAPQDIKRLRQKRSYATTNKLDYQDVINLQLENNAKRWIYLDARYIGEDADGITYLWVFSDITAIKDREQKIRLAERETKSIMRLANINSWEWNIQDSTLKLYKTGAENALNKIEPKLGQQETTIENFPAQVLKSCFLEAASKENFARYIREIKDGYNGKINKSELAIKTAPGNTVWLEVGSETIRDEEGNALKAIGYYTDITEERTKF